MDEPRPVDTRPGQCNRIKGREREKDEKTDRGEDERLVIGTGMRKEKAAVQINATPMG